MSTPPVSENMQQWMDAFERLVVINREMAVARERTNKDLSEPNLRAWFTLMKTCKEAQVHVSNWRHQLTPQELRAARQKLVEKGVLQSLDSIAYPKPQSTPVPEQTSSSLTDRVQQLSLESE